MTSSGREISRPGDATSAYSVEWSLDHYVGVIRKHQILILLICGLSVSAAVIGGMRSPKMYAATAMVIPPVSLLQPEVEFGRGAGGMEEFFLRRALSMPRAADLYAGILRSRTMLDAVIDKLDLVRAHEEKRRSITRRKLRGNMIIDVSSQGILSVTVKDRDPQRAATIANAFVEELDRQNKTLYAGQAASKRLFVENQLKEIQQEPSHPEPSSARDMAIKDTVLELLAREYEIAKIEEARNMPTIQVLDVAIPPDDYLPRNTVKKAVLAGGLSLIASLLLVHLVEHARSLRSHAHALRPHHPNRPLHG